MEFLYRLVRGLQILSLTVCLGDILALTTIKVQISALAIFFLKRIASHSWIKECVIWIVPPVLPRLFLCDLGFVYFADFAFWTSLRNPLRIRLSF